MFDDGSVTPSSSPDANKANQSAGTLKRAVSDPYEPRNNVLDKLAHDSDRCHASSLPELVQGKAVNVKAHSNSFGGFYVDVNIVPRDVTETGSLTSFWL